MAHITPTHDDGVVPMLDEFKQQFTQDPAHLHQVFCHYITLNFNLMQQVQNADEAVADQDCRLAERDVTIAMLRELVLAGSSSATATTSQSLLIPDPPAYDST
jgi:hypothetical protein